MDLLKTRTPGFGKPEGIVLAIYTAVLAVVIPYHESWFDEAQAWLIARDSTLSDLVLHRLHYEGAPALWHLLLWAEVRSHISFLGMHYIAGVIAVTGIYIWLRFNPLPQVISLLLPFSFFLQYQYAVIGRTYVLLPVFAFSLLALYQNKKSSPMLFSIFAGLLANCSLHMAAFAAGVVAVYAVDRWRMATQTGCAQLRPFVAPTFILIVLFGLSYLVARPTADGSFGDPVINKLRSVVSGSGQASSEQPASSAAGTLSEIHMPPPGQGRLAGKLWQIAYPGSAASDKAVLAGKLFKRALLIPTALTAPISTSNFLALLLLALLTFHLSREHIWLSLLPYFLVFLAVFFIRAGSHHLGILWIALICCIWILSLNPVVPDDKILLRTALYAVTFLTVLLQIQWSIYCIHADIRGPYSGDRATAQFLQGLPANMRIASFDWSSITVNAYLPKSPYFNQQTDYWPFSKTTDPSLFAEQTLAQKPDMILYPLQITDVPFSDQWLTLIAPGTVDVPLPVLNGYHETHRFCGEHFFRNTSETTDCRVVVEPISTPRVSTK